MCVVVSTLYEFFRTQSSTTIVADFFSFTFEMTRAVYSEQRERRRDLTLFLFNRILKNTRRHSTAAAKLQRRDDFVL